MLALVNGADCAFECMYYMQHKRLNQNIRYQQITLKIRFVVAEKNHFLATACHYLVCKALFCGGNFVNSSCTLGAKHH